MKVGKKVAEALQIIREGGVVAFPTDTAYALGVDPKNEAAVKKLYKIKGRKFDKPIGLVAASLQQIKNLVQLNKKEKELIEEYWPGPLTILFKIKGNNKHLKSLGQKGTIGIRVPNNKYARELTQKFNYPVTATSANYSGRKPCYTTYGIVNQFMNKIYTPDYILDGGNLSMKKVSTFVKIKSGEVEIIRKGAIKIKKDD